MKNALFVIGITLFLVAASPKPNTRPADVLTQRIYNELINIQEISSSGKHKTALAAIEKLLNSKNYNNYEQAIIMRQKSFIWVELEAFGKAASLIEQILELKILQPSAASSATLNLAQILIADEKYLAAIKTMKSWFQRDYKKTSFAYGILAQAYALAGNFDKAIHNAQLAVRSAKKPLKAHLLLLANLYLQKKFYPKALKIYELGAKLYSQEVIFWRQLAGLYAELRMPKKSFAALRTMESLGLLVNSSEKVQLAQNYLAYNAPIAAAHLLESSLDQNILEKNEKNYTMLGDAWLAAREWLKAEAPLIKAAQLANHGKIWYRLGNIYIETQQWQRATRAFENSLAQGGLKSFAQAWLLLGIALAQQKKRSQAFAALTRAIEFDETSTQAKEWLDSLRKN